MGGGLATSEWVPVLPLLRSEGLPVQDLIHPSLGFLCEKESGSITHEDDSETLATTLLAFCLTSCC